MSYRKLTGFAVDRAGNESRLKANLNITGNHGSQPAKGIGKHVE